MTDDVKPWQDPYFARNPGYLNFTLRKPMKIFRAATFNSPLVGAAALGLAAGGLGYKLAPALDRLLSPRLGGVTPYNENMSEEDKKKRKLLWGAGAGLLTAMGMLATQYSPGDPWAGFKYYAPMDAAEARAIKKHASYYPTLSLEDSSRLIFQNDSLSQRQKEEALLLLNTFNAPPQTKITGNDLVGQAISTGVDAATGAAVGFITANALGLPNPKSTAILGAVANTAGLFPALTLSTVFGQ